MDRFSDFRLCRGVVIKAEKVWPGVARAALRCSAFTIATLSSLIFLDLEGEIFAADLCTVYLSDYTFSWPWSNGI